MAHSDNEGLPVSITEFYESNFDYSENSINEECIKHQVEEFYVPLLNTTVTVNQMNEFLSMYDKVMKDAVSDEDYFDEEITYLRVREAFNIFM